jgi:hypothetical protein
LRRLVCASSCLIDVTRPLEALSCISLEIFVAFLSFDQCFGGCRLFESAYGIRRIFHSIYSDYRKGGTTVSWFSCCNGVNTLYEMCCDCSFSHCHVTCSLESPLNFESLVWLFLVGDASWEFAPTFLQLTLRHNNQTEI